MTDRELLEYAAKAAGEWGFYDGPDGYGYLGGIVGPDTENWAWNPLLSDGDAFRLAVKLRLHVSVFADAIGIGTPERGYVETKWTSDPLAATRRAIVMAAAEIGKNMV